MGYAEGNTQGYTREDAAMEEGEELMGKTKMTRADFEAELAARLEDIRSLYKRYNPEVVETGNEYLIMWVSGGTIHAMNRATYTDDNERTDKNAPCDFWIDEHGILHSTKI